MDLRNELLGDIDSALELLRVLPSSEQAIGWDDEVGARWTAVFSKLRDAVVSGRPLFPEYDHVIFVRGLDMDGICGGAIFDLAVDIGSKMRAIRTSEAMGDKG